MSSDQFETCPNCREIKVSTLALDYPKCGIPQDPATVSQKGKSNQKCEWELRLQWGSSQKKHFLNQSGKSV